VREVLVEHLEGLYALYGETHGVRVARKHIVWTTRGFPGNDAFRRTVVRIESAPEQLAAVRAYFQCLAEHAIAPGDDIRMPANDAAVAPALPARSMQNREKLAA